MEFFSLLISHLLFAGVFAALIALRSTRAKRAAGRNHLFYPIVLKIIGIVGFCLLAVGSSFAMSESKGVKVVVVAVLLLPMTAVAFLGIVEVLSTRITFDKDCIYQVSIFSKTSALRFEDLIDLSYSERWSQHLIRDSSGGVVRVSKFMIGAEELVEKVIEHLNQKKAQLAHDPLLVRI